MIPRLGPPPHPSRRYRLRTGAYGLLLAKGGMLLTFQDGPEPEFQLPGGGINPGEGPVAALHREVFEETGWRISTPRRIGAYRLYRYMPDYDLWAEKLCSVWVARPVMRAGPPTEPHHHAVWLPAAEGLRRLADPGAQTLVSRFLTG